jgi:hypothetical protein
VATFATELNEILKSADIFESVGKESLTSRLGQYSAKGFFL